MVKLFIAALAALGTLGAFVMVFSGVGTVAYCCATGVAVAVLFGGGK